MTLNFVDTFVVILTKKYKKEMKKQHYLNEIDGNISFIVIKFTRNNAGVIYIFKKLIVNKFTQNSDSIDSKMIQCILSINLVTFSIYQGSRDF